MRYLAALACAVLIAGCAQTGSRLVPGESTEAEVQAAMGKPVDTRKRTNGETWYYYTSQPYGRANYVARVGGDGKLIAFENRLNDKTVATIEKGKQTKEDLRELLGPPYRVTEYARQEREVWTYHMRNGGNSGQEMVLYVQFSPDSVVREVYEYSEDSIRAMGGSMGM